LLNAQCALSFKFYNVKLYSLRLLGVWSCVVNTKLSLCKTPRVFCMCCVNARSALTLKFYCVKLHVFSCVYVIGFPIFCCLSRFLSCRRVNVQRTVTFKFCNAKLNTWWSVLFHPHCVHFFGVKK
jgi:hypothetical protein